MSDQEEELPQDYTEDALYQFCLKQSDLDKKYYRKICDKFYKLFGKHAISRSQKTIEEWKSRGNLYHIQYAEELKEGLEYVEDQFQ